MPAFIRYPFFGCIILALSACGSSGSSRLLGQETSAMDGTGAASQEAYSSVEYLITDIPAAIAKFADTASTDMSDEEDMSMEDSTPSTGAIALNSTPGRLNTLRNSIINISTRYLSTGAVLARTDDGSVVTQRTVATCADGEVTGYAKCDFTMDALREATTFHLGPRSSMDDNRISFRGFTADREPVMFYRNVLMSQVRTLDTGESGLMDVYEDANGRKYLLTRNNVANMNLTDVELPAGVTEAPDFTDLLAVYVDINANKYLLTPDNVADMNLDGVDLPPGVTTAPDFTALTKVREGERDGYEYVGYDGMLQYSMFFVGVYRFFDDEDEPQHLRFENASLGRIYDDDVTESGIQNPSVSLTGEGVMVGMERRKSNLASHLVQGDVNINYSPFEAGDPMADPPTQDVNAMINISIDNIQRLADEGAAWYANIPLALSWSDVPVMESKFSYEDTTSSEDLSPGNLRGSFYGTEDDPEVGGVFHHEDSLYEIIGSFGSRLSEPDPEDDN